jgi:dTDP-6-deoxy-L-talose 4-dehydrogenase (NAD+)
MSLVLLTGSTGFVGRQILKVLQEKGHQVRLIIRDDSQLRIANMKGIEHIVHTPNIFTESSSWWEGVCAGVDIVIHCAWYAEPGQYLQSDKNLECLVGTLSLAKAAANVEVKRFVGIGTCFEYEMSNKPLSVYSPLSPLSPYAAAKAATYLMLSQYFFQKSLSFVWCRLFYLFGEGEDPRRFIPYLHKKLSSGEVAELTSGNQIRDFINVSVAAEKIVETAFSDIVGPTNICSGEAISIRQLAEKIAGIYNACALLNFGARPDNLVDPPYVVGVRGNKG